MHQELLSYPNILGNCLGFKHKVNVACWPGQVNIFGLTETLVVALKMGFKDIITHFKSKGSNGFVWALSTSQGGRL